MKIDTLCFVTSQTFEKFKNIEKKTYERTTVGRNSAPPGITLEAIEIANITHFFYIFKVQNIEGSQRLEKVDS